MISSLNLIAILAAAAAGFAFGAVWYMTLGRAWMAALGTSAAEIAGRRSPRPFIVSAAALVVMAFILSGLMGHLGLGAVTPRIGVVSGALVWVGFVATTLAVNHAFQGARPMLTLIDGGHWLGVLLIQGLVLGWIGR